MLHPGGVGLAWGLYTRTVCNMRACGTGCPQCVRGFHWKPVTRHVADHSSGFSEGSACWIGSARVGVWFSMVGPLAACAGSAGRSAHPLSGRAWVLGAPSRCVGVAMRPSARLPSSMSWAYYNADASVRSVVLAGNLRRSWMACSG